MSGTKVGCFEETTVFFDDHLPKVSWNLIDDNGRLRLYYSESEYLRFRTMYSKCETDSWDHRITKERFSLIIIDLCG